MTYRPAPFERRIREAFLSLLPAGTTFRFAHMRKDRPDAGSLPGETFVTLWVSSTTGRGMTPEETLTDEHGSEECYFVGRIRSLRSATLLLQSYGPDALEILAGVDARIGASYTRPIFEAAGISVSRAGRVQRVPQVLGPEEEDQATVTYDIEFYEELAFEEPALAEVNLTAELETGDGPQETINVGIEGIDAESI